MEFAECIDESNGYVTKGKIYRIHDLSIGFLRIVNDKGQEGGLLYKSSAKPSTKSAYVEQLKARAKELYGEIKDGDRFGVIIFGGHEHVTVGNSNKGFTYLKLDDELYFGDIPIYEKGKWAKKIERVRVVPSEIHYPKPDNLDQYVTVELRVIGGLLDAKKSKGAVDELAKCLEDYLNKIP